MKSVGGAYFAGNALEKEENFDIIAGNGVNANNPESNMWYEMSMLKDLIFLRVPEEVRQKIVKSTPLTTLVDLPWRAWVARARHAREPGEPHAPLAFDTRA